MKKVLLLRHAKSSWDEEALPDFQRPLAERGRGAAQRMGEYMASKGLVPDGVLCSGARRAVETWELVAPALDSPRVHIDDNLYMASPDAILAWLRRLQSEMKVVLLIGHNPGFEELARRLVGDGKKKALKQLHRKYPTGALAVIRFNVAGWPDIMDAGGYIERFIRPRDL